MSRLKPPPVWKTENPAKVAESARRNARLIREMLDGAINTTGEVTLATSSATTVVTDPRVQTPHVILLSPKTANAASELASIYVVASDGSFTINHPNNAVADRTFGYVFHTGN